jgi:glyoxylase-like metal-dependent hydrolase (beta-lactamase superfamily II)
MSASPDIALTASLGDGIFQIRLPMAGNPMRYINGYAVEEDDGLTLIDCGWKADDVLAALHAGLAEVRRTLKDVRRILITHTHFDHYGLAGTLLALGVPELAMHERDWQFAKRHLSDPIGTDAMADTWIAANGLRVETQLDDELQHHRADLIEPTRLLDDGDMVGRLRAIFTPGHSPGHLCFVDSVSGRMFTGDHVLDPVTPHVGIWYPERGDSLGEYVASLHKVKITGATGVLPAHGEPWDDLGHRVDELLAHEQTRESQVVAALEAGSRSAADVARALPWTRRNRTLDDLPPTHRQFAVAETLAHLEHLRVRNVVTRDKDARPITYTLRTS